MKKSGALSCEGVCAATCGSADAVIAPKRHQVATQILAQRHDLALEATAQLEHQLLVGCIGLAPQDAATEQPKRIAAQLLRRERLDPGLGGLCGGSSSQIERAHEVVLAWGAHADGRGRFNHLDWARVVNFQESQHAAYGPLVVSSKVIVDQNQHLLGREYRVIAA